MICSGYIVPGRPHPYLAPEKNEGWGKLRDAFKVAAQEIESSGADLLMFYSTQWLSVIGHQIQAHPQPKWIHVDPEWHAMGDLPYEFNIDTEYANAYEKAAKARGLHTRTVAYDGFPIDTGTIVAMKMLNPDNKIKACMVSCNMYADRGETLVLGKAARDAMESLGRKVIPIAVTSFSNRIFTKQIDPKDDRIYSLKDDEWNKKLLEFLNEGRLEDVSQLARQFSNQANGDQKMKALWWLAATMGQNNAYDGKVLEYQPIWGSGAALVSLKPAPAKGMDREFDEDDVEFFTGGDSVLSQNESVVSSDADSSLSQASNARADKIEENLDSKSDSSVIRTHKAPAPVGAYPHARREGNLIYLSGIGPRQAGTDAIPGGPVRDSSGNTLDYDAKAQTIAVIENIKTILENAGSRLENVIDVTTFLIDMDRDFVEYNKVYAEYFGTIQASRTTVEVRALPTPIAVEMKMIAKIEP